MMYTERESVEERQWRAPAQSPTGPTKTLSSSTIMMILATLYTFSTILVFLLIRYRLMAGVKKTVKLDDRISAGITTPLLSEDTITKKLQFFRKFDCVENHSAHFYLNKKQSHTQTSSWKKKIQAEWRMMVNDLPDTIYVRVYEARMDLLRAAIVGADGTSYHDGLFFFDVHFTSFYPAEPPLVKYHAHGLHINPNLYNSGKVCPSLLGTWKGRRTERWQPEKSNMLQVLVSIQALILNAEPFFNEPAFAYSVLKSMLSSTSKEYNENVFLLTLKTMLYTMKNPPKYFEDLVYGHFHRRAHDILSACRACLDGVKVGSFVNGKTQETQIKEGKTRLRILKSFFKGKAQDTQVTKRTCSELLRMNLPSYVKSLVEAFTKIGVKDCEKYLVPVPSDPDRSR